MRTLVQQYRELLTSSRIINDTPQTPDRATATMSKVGDRLAQTGVWTADTVHRLLAVAVRRLSEAQS